MACLKILKEDVKTIKSVFPETHERFQTISATVDELNFNFIDENGDKYQINAIIPEFYPKSPPVWFAITENAEVLSAVNSLSETSGSDNYITNQVTILLKKLCHIHSVPEPLDLVKLTPATSSTSSADPGVSKPPAEKVQVDDFEEDEDNDSSDAPDYEITFDEEIAAKRMKTDDDIDEKVLKEIQAKNEGIGSQQANECLLKELKNIHKSDGYKNKMFTVNLVDNCLYEWKIGIRSVDCDSPLSKDLELLKEKEGKDSIVLLMSFTQHFPYDPPFVRVIDPIISGGFVTSGGALCLEVLTKQGWSSAYTIENLIVQIAASLVTGKGRIRQFVDPPLPPLNPEVQYTLANAAKSFTDVMKVHQTRGWHTPLDEDG